MNKTTKQEHYQNDLPYQSSHLFLVRVWLEKTVDNTDGAQLQGRVQDVSTGQAHYFCGGSELTKVLHHMMPQSQNAKSDETAHDDELQDLAHGSAYDANRCKF